MSSMTPDFDIGIIGGGPAGAALAAYLAKAGVSCVVFERERFPRPHVGESLVPSCNRVFKDLDFLKTMEDAKFIHKYGGSWSLRPDRRADIRFYQEDDPEVEQEYAYHVDRAKFDALLLRHARQLGATVHEKTAVSTVDFSNGSNPTIQCSGEQGPQAVSVRLVVDASGRRTLLGTQLKLKVHDPIFDQFAIHTWFEGFDRNASEPHNYLVVHVLPITNSWIWQIPISDSVTSFGMVTQRRHFAKTKATREQFFWDGVKTRPDLLARLKSATQIRPFTEEGDYSYAMRQIVGDRFLLIGDAARFVDPIFSSGVSVALNSARLAAPDILGALRTGVLTRESFARYETLTQQGIKNWYEFITLYYRLHILFTLFVRDPRHRLDVLKLLRGDVYDAELPPVLERMKEIVKAVERNPNHVWHHLLGDLDPGALKTPSRSGVSAPTAR